MTEETSGRLYDGEVRNREVKEKGVCIGIPSGVSLETSFK